MTRTMHDSTTVGDIPRGATLVAGYVDGNFQTVAGLRKRFPKAKVVTITVLGTPGAQVCDTEPGNIGIAGAAAWAANEVRAGRHPTLYCMASQWPQVKQAVKAKGIAGKVSYWVADYDGKPEIPRGAVAKQYADPKLSGGHFDLSLVADHWPGVDSSDDAAPATELDPVGQFLAVQLKQRLSRRKKPVGAGRDALEALTEQIERVLKLG